MGSWHGLCPGAWIYAIASRCILKEILSTNIVSNCKKLSLPLKVPIVIHYKIWRKNIAVNTPQVDQIEDKTEVFFTHYQVYEHIIINLIVLIKIRKIWNPEHLIPDPRRMKLFHKSSSTGKILIIIIFRTTFKYLWH